MSSVKCNSHTIQVKCILYTCRGIARTGPKGRGGGGTHLEFEFEALPTGRGNLEFGHLTWITPEPRGCLSPLSPPLATPLTCILVQVCHMQAQRADTDTISMHLRHFH